jgi:hypothetical protein
LANAGLRADAIIYWRRRRTHDGKNALQAAEPGHDSIASPNSATCLAPAVWNTLKGPGWVGV